jgi:RNA polymerase sigma-70 factor (ECF subfamily)
MSDIQELTAIKLILEDHDAEQYRIIVDRYHRGLVQHLYNLCYDQAVAEDLAQEAFLRAYTKLDQYNQAYAFSTWLYKIADNMAYRLLKSTKPTTDISQLEQILPSDSETPADLAEKNLAKSKVQASVAKLPLTYRQVVSLYYWDGFSYEEIAEIMDRPVGTIRTWLFRAKETLRKDLYGQV